MTCGDMRSMVQEAAVDFPEYDLRRAACARDPLAVVEAFRVHILLRLSALLGVRMCPLCPRCNAKDHGCQDIFGNSARPVGGVLGAMIAFGGAVEHQNHGTPHFHWQGHLACAYQYGTLKDVAARLSQQSMTADDVKRFNQWLHREDILDDPTYKTMRESAESDWWEGYAQKEHTDMSTTPDYLTKEAQSTNLSTLWSATEAEQQSLIADGARWRKTYFQDAQRVFSRVQHHTHRKTKKGYEPLKSCLSKRTRTKGCCKADFPKTKLCVPKALVVCQGLARKLGLRVSGRRNSFGMVVGKRRCEWQSGTTPSFAVLFRSNSHTMPNYRLPLLPSTHEAVGLHKKMHVVR